VKLLSAAILKATFEAVKIIMVASTFHSLNRLYLLASIEMC